jgi:hypothetical protein
MGEIDLIRRLQAATRRATAAERARDAALREAGAVCGERDRLAAAVEEATRALARMERRAGRAAREAYQASAADLAWHGRELRILRRQVRHLTGVLRANAGAFLGAEDADVALAHLDEIEAEERQYSEM